MTLIEFRSRLLGSGVSDILLPGFVAQGETPVRFHPMPQTVYFECNSLYLKMETISSTGNMRLSIDDKVEISVPIEEEDMTAAVTSLREQYLDDSDGRNNLSAIRLWNVTEDETGFRCAAAQLDLANGQQIFVDPTYHFGIRIGGSRQRDIWRENWPAAECALESIVVFIDG